jgi:hypothetical protein
MNTTASALERHTTAMMLVATINLLSTNQETLATELQSGWPASQLAAGKLLVLCAGLLTQPNKQQKMPLPSMPMDRKILRSVLSPKCPAKNMPAA